MRPPPLTSFTWINLISVWIIITSVIDVAWNSVPKLQRCIRWILGIDRQSHSKIYFACDHLSMPQLKLDVHYYDVIMGAIASQTTSLTIVYSTVYSGGDQRKHQSFASLAFVLGIQRGLVNSPHKWPVSGNVSISWRHHVMGYKSCFLVHRVTPGCLDPCVLSARTAICLEQMASVWISMVNITYM